MYKFEFMHQIVDSCYLYLHFHFWFLRDLKNFPPFQFMLNFKLKSLGRLEPNLDGIFTDFVFVFLVWIEHLRLPSGPIMDSDCLKFQKSSSLKSHGRFYRCILGMFELNSIFLRRFLNCFHYSLLSNFGPQCLINIRQWVLNLKNV
jgi:hypothetical protein